jgi:hypothetical protein
MEYCSFCGAPLPSETSQFCPRCGSAVSAAAPVASDSREAERNNRTMRRSRLPLFTNAPAGLTRREFVQKYSNGAKQCVSAAVIGYISAGITTIVIATGSINYINAMAFLDVAVILALCILIHTLKSRVASVILFIYAIYSIIVILIASGVFSGWLIALAGILALSGSFTCEKEWKMYLVRMHNMSQMTNP